MIILMNGVDANADTSVKNDPTHNAYGFIRGESGPALQ